MAAAKTKTRYKSHGLEKRKLAMLASCPLNEAKDQFPFKSNQIRFVFLRQHVHLNRDLAIELLCRARLHNRRPHRVISGNKHLFHHGGSFCISWISSAVGICQACVSHSRLQPPRGNKQTIRALASIMIHHQWDVTTEVLFKCTTVNVQL